MKRLLYLGMVMLVLLLMAIGCGGGGGTPSPTPTPGGATATPAPTATPVTISLATIANQDGHVFLSGGLNNQVISYTGDSEEFTSDTGCRVVVSFDLSSIPSGAQIQSATLSVYTLSQLMNVGHDPFGLGALKVDHVDFTGALTDTIYDKAALSLVGTLATSLGSAGYRSISVTLAVQNDLTNSRAYSQFRLYHTTECDNDGKDDMTFWYMSECTADGDTTNDFPPTLSVTYTQ